MSHYYKLVNNKDPHTSWTSEVVLERDSDGNVSKSARVGEPAQFSAEDKKKLEGLGFSFESSSKEEAEKYEEEANESTAALDTASAGPVFNTPTGVPNQADLAGIDQPTSDK